MWQPTPIEFRDMGHANGPLFAYPLHPGNRQVQNKALVRLEQGGLFCDVLAVHFDRYPISFQSTTRSSQEEPQ